MRRQVNKIFGMLFAVLTCALLWINGAGTAEAATASYFHAYAKYDYETVSDRYALTVNGKSVDVVSYYNGRYDYAHIAYEGTTTFQVKSLKGNIESYNVSPHSYGLKVTKSGNTLTFDMEQKGSRYVLVEIKVGGKEYQLFISCDPKLDIAVPAGRRINIMDRGIQMPYDKADGLKNSEIIQKAIDELSAAGGGTLYFPAGTYKFVTIDAKDNVTLYLDEGAVLRGSGKRTDYGWNDSGQNGRQVKRKDILIQDCKNFSIIGYGMVDANAIPLALKKNLITSPNVDNRAQPSGYYPDGWDDFRKGIVDARNSEGITFRGVAFKDATGWTFDMQTSKNIEMTNVKILDDWDVVHSDGYDFGSSQNVTVTNCLGICGDDVFCPKAEYAGKDTCNMLFKDCVAFALGGAGCKVGVAARSDAYNIEFNNIDVIQGYRGFSLSHDENSGKWEDIRFIDIRTERLHIANPNNIGGQYRPAPFVIWTMNNKGGTGPIDDILVKNCYIENCSNLWGYIQGYSQAGKVSNVTFENFKMDGVKITEANYAEHIKHGDNISNIKYDKAGSTSTSTSGATLVYEAEKATVAGGAAIVNKNICSDGAMVGNIGGNGKTNGKVTFNVNAPTAGTYDLKIYYLLNGTRRFYATVNNGESVAVECTGSNWNAIKDTTIQVALNAGANTIRLDNGAVDQWAPNLDKIELTKVQTVYEAENAKVADGAAIVNKGICSGDKMVGNIGGNGKNNGKVTFDVNVAAAGTYDMTIYYLLNGSRSFFVTVNNGNFVEVKCTGSNWEAVKTKTIQITLKAGANTIRLDNGSENQWAPNLDKIELSPASVASYEAEDGTFQNGAVATSKSGTSGDKKVGNIGGTNNGICTITVNAPKAGKAYMDIYYITNGTRRFYITVNNNPYFGVDCEGTSWNTVKMKTVEIELKAGNNTIKFDNGSGSWAPDLDKIDIRMQ